MDLFAQSQVFISEKWSGPGGLTAMYHHNVSKTDSQRNVYVAGSTINTAGNHDIILQKFNRTGTLLWEQTYNGLANMDDMAADIFIDDQFNVYVTGTITETVQSGYDLCVLKYDSQGTLQWLYSYDNGAFPLPYDAGTAITGDNNGSIFVTGGSMADTTMSDFVTIRLNTSDGNEVWTQRYDYTALNDIAAKIAVKDGQVVVSGASQSSTSPDKWELATLTYAVSNGNLINENRTSGSATDGVDEIYDITVDEDYIYVAGAVNNTTTGFDIRIYKLDDELNIVWEEDFDGYEGADKAHGIKVDSDGNVYVAGFVTHPSQGRNYVTIKFDSDGVLQWHREYNGQANANDEAVQLVIDDQDRIFVTGKLRNNDYTDYVTVGYYSNGDIFGQAIFYSPSGLNDEPAAITIDLDGNLIVTGQCEQPGGAMRTVTVKYQVYDKPFDPVIIDSVPSHNANELLIRFDRSVMNYAAVDNRAFTAGALSDFVKPQVIDSMNAKVPGVDFKKLEAYKVMLRMTTADSLSITRLGDTTVVDDFWATLSVILPKSINEKIASDSLNLIYPLIIYNDLNHIGTFHSTPNDNLYLTNQSGLFDSSHGINIEPAWQIQTGQDHTRVGVFDTGINWRHEDFGDGTWNGSKVYGGWDFFYNVHPSTQQFLDISPNAHGTRISGIIGALRNNELGIAGIAGGDWSVLNPGAALYAMNLHPSFYDGNSSQEQLLYVGTAFQAILEGAIYTDDGFGYGLNIQNHSWGGPHNILLEHAVKLCYKQSCVFVASSGNTGTQSIEYPASYTDDWVLKVGASDATGNRLEWSTYGNALDIIAPGANELFISPHNTVNNFYNVAEGNGATSWAAPHVAGVAALMHSEHHVNNGYPNNLAPDDIEFLIQEHATDVPPAGYNIESGYGRLNAGEVLEHMSLPEYHILHVGGQPGSGNPIETITNNQIVDLTYNTNGVNPGFYNANLHKITQTFVEVLPVGYEVIDHWTRYSSSSGTSDFYQITNSDYFSYSIDINDNVVTVTTNTWCWFITTNLGQGPVYKWVPAMPNQLTSAVSLRIRNSLPTSIVEVETMEVFKISPNPSSDGLFNVSYDFKTKDNLRLRVTDLLGRHITQIEINDQTDGLKQTQLDLSSYSTGVYICSVLLKDGIRSKRIIVH